MCANCIICYGSSHLENGDSLPLSCAPCGHVFHTSCMFKWLDAKGGPQFHCPDCRAKWPTQAIHPLYIDLYSASPRPEQTPIRSFAAGEMVLASEPWVWSFGREHYLDHCANCWRPSSSLWTCKCNLHRYCRRDECQSAARSQEHQNECGMLRDIAEHIFPVICEGNHSCTKDCRRFGCCAAEILMAKIISKIRNGHGWESVVENGRADVVADLIGMPFPATQYYQDLIDRYKRSALAATVWPSTAGIPSFSRLVQTVYYNAFPICSPRDKKKALGVGMFPDVLHRAMTPAFCDSDTNVTMDWQGRRLVFRATKDIQGYTELKQLRHIAWLQYGTVFSYPHQPRFRFVFTVFTLPVKTIQRVSNLRPCYSDKSTGQQFLKIPQKRPMFGFFCIMFPKKRPQS